MERRGGCCYEHYITCQPKINTASQMGTLGQPHGAQHEVFPIVIPLHRKAFGFIWLPSESYHKRGLSLSAALACPQARVWSIVLAMSQYHQDAVSAALAGDWQGAHNIVMNYADGA
jgi:hypothetical protein